VSRRNTTTSKRLERRDERQARRPGTSAPPPTRRNRRAAATQRRRKRGLPLIGELSLMKGAIIVGVAAVVAILAYAVTQSGNTPAQASWQQAQLDSSTSLPGQYIPPHPGADGQIGTTDDRNHFGATVRVPICTNEQLATNRISDPLCYNSNPPTSGPHNSSPMPFRVLENPAPRENLIHNMEHGGVVIWYNTTNQAVIDQLKQIAQARIDRRQLVVMTQYPDMEAETIALTAWTRLDKFSVNDFNRARVENFIDKHHKRFNPEGF
jgi:hypothetical protein